MLITWVRVANLNCGGELVQCGKKRASYHRRIRLLRRWRRGRRGTAKMRGAAVRYCCLISLIFDDEQNCLS